jgi:hypothetical protein
MDLYTSTVQTIVSHFQADDFFHSEHHERHACKYSSGYCPILATKYVSHQNVPTKTLHQFSGAVALHVVLRPTAPAHPYQEILSLSCTDWLRSTNVHILPTVWVQDSQEWVLLKPLKRPTRRLLLGIGEGFASGPNGDCRSLRFP